MVNRESHDTMSSNSPAGLSAALGGRLTKCSVPSAFCCSSALEAAGVVAPARALTAPLPCFPCDMIAAAAPFGVLDVSAVVCAALVQTRTLALEARPNVVAGERAA